MSPAPPHPPRAPRAPLAPHALSRGPCAPSSASFPARGAGGPFAPAVPPPVILQPWPPFGGSGDRGRADGHPHPPEGLRERGRGELVPGRAWREVAGEGAQPPRAPPGPVLRGAPPPARPTGRDRPSGTAAREAPEAQRRRRPRLPVLCQQDLEQERLGPGFPPMGGGEHLGRRRELRALFLSGLEGTVMVAQMGSCSPWDPSRN